MVVEADMVFNIHLESALTLIQSSRAHWALPSLLGLMDRQSIPPTGADLSGECFLSMGNDAKCRAIPSTFKTHFRSLMQTEYLLFDRTV